LADAERFRCVTLMHSKSLHRLNNDKFAVINTLSVKHTKYRGTGSLRGSRCCTVCRQKDTTEIAPPQTAVFTKGYNWRHNK